jgi:hypothetical protein
MLFCALGWLSELHRIEQISTIPRLFDFSHDQRIFPSKCISFNISSTNLSGGILSPEDSRGRSFLIQILSITLFCVWIWKENDQPRDLYVHLRWRCSVPILSDRTNDRVVGILSGCVGSSCRFLNANSEGRDIAGHRRRNCESISKPYDTVRSRCWSCFPGHQNYWSGSATFDRISPEISKICNQPSGDFEFYGNDPFRGFWIFIDSTEQKIAELRGLPG